MSVEQAKALCASIEQAGRYIGRSLRVMAGVPDYGTYLAHMRENHPGAPVMDYETFFVDRQNARYGATGRPARCC
jgi:uncharacterized short protein YbdD (DUF466 family)